MSSPDTFSGPTPPRDDDTQLPGPAALDALLQHHLPGLHAYLRLRAGRVILGKESVTDLVQSVCREILEDLDQRPLTSEGMFRHWLYQTAERKILDRARHHGRAKRDAALEARPGAWEEAASLMDCYRSFVTPSRAASAREELAMVEQAMSRLPEASRDLIILSRIVGLSHAEIAQQLGKTEVAVRTALSRALARLSMLLE